MPKLYTNLYVGASDGLVTPKSKAVLSIATGKRLTVKLGVVASEGQLVALYVRQASGTAKAFDVEVLTSAAPYPVGGSAAYNDAAAAGVGPFRVLPKQVVTSGNVAEVFEPTGYAYQNADAASQAESQRYLYLTIIPANTVDTTTWEVRVTTEHSGVHV